MDKVSEAFAEIYQTIKDGDLKYIEGLHDHIEELKIQAVNLMTENQELKVKLDALSPAIRLGNKLCGGDKEE